ncbi:MAG: TraR/DksA C4-type zinc finger protein [bacterium]
MPGSGAECVALHQAKRVQEHLLTITDFNIIRTLKGDSNMTITAVATRTRSRITGRPSPNATSSVPPPSRLTTAQQRELETELRRELVALERRLVSERHDESAEPHVVAAHDVSVAMRGTSDTVARHDVVANALARLASGAYGACSRCGEPIPYGRLVVMPEAIHCLRCSGRS